MEIATLFEAVLEDETTRVWHEYLHKRSRSSRTFADALERTFHSAVDQDNEALKNLPGPCQFLSIPTLEYQSCWMISTSRNAFPFLSLPDEIRIIIYRMCLTLPQQLFLFCKPRRNLNRGTEARHLLQVCRQVREEAWPYWYQYNHFRFYGIQPMYDSLTNMGLDWPQRLRRITVTYAKQDLLREYGNTFYWPAWRLLRSCESLQYFCLELLDMIMEIMKREDALSWNSLLEIIGLHEVYVQETSRIPGHTFSAMYRRYQARMDWLARTHRLARTARLAGRLMRAWLRP